NTVTAGGFGTGGSAGQADGGALYNLAYGNNFADGTAVSATVTLGNSILAQTSGGTNDLVTQEIDGDDVANTGNTASGTANNPNIVVNRLDAGHGTNGTSDLTLAGLVTATNANVGLQSLTDNGGPTPTMALGSGPAIGAGVVVPGITTDQRGVTRDNPP